MNTELHITKKIMNYSNDQKDIYVVPNDLRVSFDDDCIHAEKEISFKGTIGDLVTRLRSYSDEKGDASYITKYSRNYIKTSVYAESILEPDLLLWWSALRIDKQKYNIQMSHGNYPDTTKEFLDLNKKFVTYFSEMISRIDKK